MKIRIAGVLGAVALVLTGCGSGEAKPKVLPPASVGASPSAGAVSIPPEAKAATSQGASAFARHYMAVLTRALQTADASELERLSDAGCGGVPELHRSGSRLGDRG